MITASSRRSGTRLSVGRSVSSPARFFAASRCSFFNPQMQSVLPQLAPNLHSHTCLSSHITSLNAASITADCCCCCCHLALNWLPLRGALGWKSTITVKLTSVSFYSSSRFNCRLVLSLVPIHRAGSMERLVGPGGKLEPTIWNRRTQQTEEHPRTALLLALINTL